MTNKEQKDPEFNEIKDVLDTGYFGTPYNHFSLDKIVRRIQKLGYTKSKFGVEATKILRDEIDKLIREINGYEISRRGILEKLRRMQGDYVVNEIKEIETKE